MSERTELNKRQQSKVATRAKVLAAARKLWAEPGSYETQGIREIAAEMGMSVGAVFNNFDSKADLWREAMGYEPPVDCEAVRWILRVSAEHDEVERELAAMNDASPAAIQKATA